MKTDIRLVNPPALCTELLILSDGQVLAHNLTPPMARLLLELNPSNKELSQRAARRNAHARPTKN
jgi:hypothetical protein